ncbi:MAG: hypothetical protein K6B41_03715 [Butyrivibrio sp.]|nr:hypothetical protein [Butyrivibrio sp.]
MRGRVAIFGLFVLLLIFSFTIFSNIISITKIEDATHIEIVDEESSTDRVIAEKIMRDFGSDEESITIIAGEDSSDEIDDEQEAAVLGVKKVKYDFSFFRKHKTIIFFLAAFASISLGIYIGVKHVN